MPIKNLYDVVIVGSGLAGLTLADTLAAQNLKIAIIDSDELGKGASGVPLSLINPIAGKQAKLTWQASSCLTSIEHRLERISRSSGLSFYAPSGILRPAMDEVTFEKFKKSYQKSFAAEDWIHFLDEDQLRSMLPKLTCVGGGYWLEKGGVVETPTYLKALLEVVQNAGVEVFFQQRALDITAVSELWRVKSLFQEVHTKKLVMTTGFRTKEVPFWNWLPVHTIKGQVLHYRSHSFLPWTYGISGEGYLAHLNGYDWVIGSTYEHTFNDEYPDALGLETLEEKADLHFTELRKHSTLIQHWASVRLGTPNRLPVIGGHPSFKNLFVFAGMGSKGLLYSSYLAELLADNLLHPASTLPIEVSVKRFIST